MIDHMTPTKLDTLVTIIKEKRQKRNMLKKGVIAESELSHI